MVILETDESRIKMIGHGIEVGEESPHWTSKISKVSGTGVGVHHKGEHLNSCSRI